MNLIFLDKDNARINGEGELVDRFGTPYDFQLTRIPGTGEITITLLQGVTVLDSFTVFDATYGAGQFGFYNFSEDSVTYSGFTADQITPVPEPSSLFVFSTALIGAAGFAARRRRAA